MRATSSWAPFAIAGYLVAGIGDAVEEPVGTLRERRPYRVPSIASVTATRTWEGSAAVFLGSTLALLLAAGLPPQIVFPDGAAWKVPLQVAPSEWTRGGACRSL